MTPIIFHNPNCGTSRNTLAIILASGETPNIIEYLKTPPTREYLVELLDLMNLSPRALLRQKEMAALGLDESALSDEQLLDAMIAHPILINRPIVVTDKGAALCRPSERVFDLLTHPISRFVKEDGEVLQYLGSNVTSHIPEPVIDLTNLPNIDS